jgi:hypothetical protein
MFRLRQIALVASDLSKAEADVEAALGVQRCFRDPGVGAFGLTNALYPLGDQFLEIVSPHQDGTTAGRLIEKRGGDGGYMVLVQTDDLTSFRQRFESLGVRIVHEAVDAGIVGLHIHPKDIGGAVVSVDQTDEPAEWTWAGPAWRNYQRADVVLSLAAVEIQADDPDAMASRWGEVLGRPVVGGELACDDGVLRFVQAEDGRGNGVGGFDVVAADPDKVGTAIDLVGARVRFVD